MHDTDAAAHHAGTPTAPDTSSVTGSGEKFAELPTGVTLCHETFGDPADPTVLLVMGLGGPMTWWDAAFCRQLAATGRHVVRYDNRDTGRSTSIAARVGKVDLVRAWVGLRTAAPYSIADLAGDAVALLDHLGVERADVVGVSMGGMIAQTIAIEHPDRVRSLTSIMSTTGRRTVGWQHPKLLPMLLADRASGQEAYVEGSVRLNRVIGSPGFPAPDRRLRAIATETWVRGTDRAGVVRQMLAVLTQPDRTDALGRVRVPTLVLHGANDVMVHPSGGRATSAAVPGSRFVVVDGMGHDLPEPLWGLFVDAIDEVARQAG